MLELFDELCSLYACEFESRTTRSSARAGNRVFDLEISQEPLERGVLEGEGQE